MSTPELEGTTVTSLDKKLIRTSPVLWGLGLVLALFLCGIGSQILADLADFISAPRSESFYSQVRSLEAQRSALQDAPNPRLTQVTRAERDLEDQERVLKTAEDSWRTWLQTRATLGQAGREDTEVRERRNQLDTLRKDRDAAERALSDLKAQPDPREAQLADLDVRTREAQEKADRAYGVAYAAWRWKVLAARMGFVVPVWAVAVWLWSGRQKNRYITLAWGYWGFAAWTLLYGVVPYLPQYGGYVPLTLGAVTTAWVSVSTVRRFNQQADQRRRRIVDRALARHQCPGCERDYLLGSESGFDAGVARKANVTHYQDEALRPRNCPACGLALFGPCARCSHLQSVHQDYCSACGQAWHTGEPAQKS